MDRHSVRGQDIELEKRVSACARHVALRLPLPPVDKPLPRGVEWLLCVYNQLFGSTILKVSSACRRRNIRSSPH